MTKTVAVLGSTGSIGRQTLQVVQELGLTVAALTANRQVDLLEQQARQFHPKLAVLYDRAAAGELRLRLSDTDIRVAAGPGGASGGGDTAGGGHSGHRRHGQRWTGTHAGGYPGEKAHRSGQ